MPAAGRGRGRPPTTRANSSTRGAGQNASRESSADDQHEELRGSSPLTTLPEEEVAARNSAENQSSRASRDKEDPQRAESDRTTHEPEEGVNLIDELATLVDNAHERYETVQNQLIDCVNLQEQLSNRFISLRDTTRREQRRLTDAVQRIRNKYMSNEEQQRLKKSSKSSDAVSYADPDDLIERSRNQLFRPRDMDETSSDYRLRENAQNRLMAREHYEDGVRERNRNATRWWQERVAQENGLGHGVGFQFEEAAPTPEGGDPDNSSSSSDNDNGHNDGRDDLNPNRRNSDQRRRDSDREDDNASRRSGRGQGHGGGGPPAQPPSGGGSSSHGGGGGPPRGGAPRRDRSRSAGPRRGFTRSPTYLREDEYPLIGNGWTDPNAEFVDAQLRIIRRAIRDRVGHELGADSPALKNLKSVPSPEKYDGKDDSELFMSWLKLLLRWMESTRIIGPDLDGTRVSLLGQFLSDAARDWYDDTVDNIESGRVWAFEDAICAMYKRFIHKSTARTAADKFHSAQYKKSSGVNGLWEYMKKHSIRMPVAPDEYTFNCKFVDALPEEIVVPMFQNKNISSEKTPSAVLKRVALEQEINNRVVEEYRAAHRKKQATRETDVRGFAHQLRMTSNQGSVPPRIAAHSANASRPVHGDSRNRMSRREGNRDFARNGVAARPNNAAPQASNGTHSATAGGQPSVPPNPDRRVNVPSRPQSGRPVVCYNCQEPGHIAPNCPKNGTPKMRAARIVDEAATMADRTANDAEVASHDRGVLVEDDDESRTGAAMRADDDEPKRSTPDGNLAEDDLEYEYNMYGGGSQYDSADELPVDDYSASGRPASALLHSVGNIASIAPLPPTLYIAQYCIPYSLYCAMVCNRDIQRCPKEGVLAGLLLDCTPHTRNSETDSHCKVTTVQNEST